MSKKQNVIAGVKLLTESPTELTFRQLYTWVIWQVPKKKLGGLMGAVRPPEADHGWFPAIINVKDKRANVHAHLSRVFETPEKAVEYLNTL